MKIELEISDKYKDTNLYLMWGMVPIAKWQWANQYWEIRVDDCSRCGKCCRSKNVPFYDGEKCKFLENSPGNGFICSLKSLRPFDCCVGVSLLSDCTVVWRRT